MICFICKSNFPTLKLLVVHLKVFHLLKTNSTYECVEESSHQNFQRLNSFKRHISNKHIYHKTQIFNFNNLIDNFNFITNIQILQMKVVTKILQRISPTCCMFTHI